MSEILRTQRQIDADRVLENFYGLLGYPYLSPNDLLITHPPEVTPAQVNVICDLTLDPLLGLQTLEALNDEALTLEPGWSNLDPDKRSEVARHGSELFHRAFGHIAIEA